MLEQRPSLLEILTDAAGNEWVTLTPETYRRLHTEAVNCHGMLFLHALWSTKKGGFHHQSINVVHVLTGFNPDNRVAAALRRQTPSWGTVVPAVDGGTRMEMFKRAQEYWRQVSSYPPVPVQSPGGRIQGQGPADPPPPPELHHFLSEKHSVIRS